jgi:hypothetical protein
MTSDTTSRRTVIRHDDTINVREETGQVAAPRTRRRTTTVSAAAGEKEGRDTVLEALAAIGVDTGERIVLSPNPTPGGRRAAQKVVPPVIEVPVDSGQQVALLVEHDGILEWQLPDPPKVTRRTRTSVATRTFHLSVPRAHGAGRRGPLLDWIIDQIVTPVRVVVVRFAAGIAVDQLMQHLEKKIETGLVDMTANESEWRPSASGKVKLSGNSILLFLHGTFSSTLGSFGALTTTAAGQSLLSEVGNAYDAVLGFDHHTLSETPTQNASALLDALRALPIEENTTIDIVAYSRGGLVAREVVESLLPEDKWPIRIGKVVFVGATNGGTALASRGKWKAMLDLYTNLAVAAGKGLGVLAPGIGDTIATQAIKTLGAFAQAVVDVAITEKMVPGIAAMSPDSDVVLRLNGPLAPQPMRKVEYFAISSDFNSSALAPRPAQDRSLPLQLQRWIADRAVDQLMDEANDLVVNTAAMTRFGDHNGRLRDRFAWESNPVVHHLNYFAQPGVAHSLRMWLQAGKPKPSPLISVGPLVLDSLTSLGNAKVELRPVDDDAAVVIRRSDINTYYVRTAQQLRTLSGGRDVPLHQALDLHEDEAATQSRAIDPPLRTVGSTGWVRIVKGKVTEAAPPPVALGSVAWPDVPSDVAAPSSPAPEPWLEALAFDRPVMRGSREPSAAPPSVGDRGAPTAAAAAPDKPDRVTCNFSAEMPPTIPAERSAELTVTISREEIEKHADMAFAGGATDVRVDEPIQLHVRAMDNCKVLLDTGRVDETSATIEVPAAGKPETHDFRIVGGKPGPAELWIDARQGSRRLVRLVLQVTVVATDQLKVSAVVDTAEADPPLVSLKIYEETADNGFRLRFVMESRELALPDGVQIDEVTQTLNGNREALIQSIYDKLENHWSLTGTQDQQQRYKSFMLRLQAMGGDLFDRLAPASVRQAIWDHRDEIGSIEVVSHEPFIPWELLYVTDPQRKATAGGKFLGEFGLVRWFPNHGFPPARLAVRHGQARHVVPDYGGTVPPLPAAREERKLLQGLFGSTEVTGGADEIVRLIEVEDQFDLLHFACHGEASTGRIWDAALLTGPVKAPPKGYGGDLLEVTMVSHYAKLRGNAGQRPIVFLNACQTGRNGRALSGTGGMAEAFVHRGAGLFIGTQWSIGDSSALTFAEVFYGSLKRGDTVVKATRLAREKAKQANEPTWLAYTVYGHPYARLASG